MVVANRTYEKAVALAAQFGGAARRFDDLPQLLTASDIVVCSTAAPHPIVTRDLVKSVLRARRGRPLYLVDIAVPRDVEAGVDTLENVYLYNIDHLQGLVAGARQSRAGEVARAREIVEASVAEYLRWERSLEVAPLVVAVRQKLDSVRLAETRPPPRPPARPVREGLARGGSRHAVADRQNRPPRHCRHQSRPRSRRRRGGIGRHPPGVWAGGGTPRPPQSPILGSRIGEGGRDKPCP